MWRFWFTLSGLFLVCAGFSYWQDSQTPPQPKIIEHVIEKPVIVNQASPPVSPSVISATPVFDSHTETNPQPITRTFPVDGQLRYSGLDVPPKGHYEASCESEDCRVQTAAGTKDIVNPVPPKGQKWIQYFTEVVRDGQWEPVDANTPPARIYVGGTGTIKITVFPPEKNIPIEKPIAFSLTSFVTTKPNHTWDFTVIAHDIVSIPADLNGGDLFNVDFTCPGSLQHQISGPQWGGLNNGHQYRVDSGLSHRPILIKNDNSETCHGTITLQAP